MTDDVPGSDEPSHCAKVVAPNPFGYIDHGGLGSSAADLVFGRKASGGVIHISQASSGRACGCACPACGVDLIAKKGSIIVAHFAHAGKGSGCGQGAETNAHFWAKEILLRLKRIRLPEFEVEFEDKYAVAQQSRWLTFSDAESEVWTPGLIPDIVLTHASGDKLHVEVHVTHRCGEEKIARLTERGTPSIEIDLGAWRTSNDPKEIEKALLDTAPRKWLFHRKQREYAEAFRDKVIAERLAAEENRVAEEKRKKERQQEIALKTGQQIAEKIRASKVELAPAAQIPDISPNARGLMLPELECWGFAVEPEDWQAAILVRCFDVDMKIPAATPMLSAGVVLTVIRDLVCEGAAGSYGVSVLQAMGDLVVGYGPRQAIEVFLRHLVDCGFLADHGDECFRHSHEVSAQRSRRADLIEMQQQRKTRIITLLDALEKAVESDFDPTVLAEWIHTPLPGDTLSPANMPFVDDVIWEPFKAQLQDIVAMAEGGAPAQHLLGLPLEQELELARARQRAAEGDKAADRLERLEQLASELLGASAELWLAGKPFDELSPREAALLGESELSQLMTELQILHQAEQESARRLAAMRDRANRLTQQAEELLGVERGALFLRSYHPKLGRSPITNLDTATGLRQALDILKFVDGTSGRRR